jgi:4'-phosphopantetheinyl transferase EntD
VSAIPVALSRATAWGQLVGIALPADDDDPALDVLAASLVPEEQAHARGLPPARRVTWVGGRVALRRALAELGVTPGPLMATPRGAPALPPGVAGSIAHKRTLAVALAAPALADVTLGVDVEVDRALRVDISERVLTPVERGRLDALAVPARATALLRAFAAKEAIYKALDPWLRRHVAFAEVEVDAGAGRFTPRPGEPRFAIELRDEPLAAHVLVTARVQRLAG